MDGIFVEHPDLRKYIFDGVAAPTDQKELVTRNLQAIVNIAVRLRLLKHDLASDRDTSLFINESIGIVDMLL